MENIDYNITEYGIFDSTAKFPNVITTRERTVEEFEIELYTADCKGTTYINSKPVKLSEGLIICAKPGQKRYSKLHFKCFYIHIKANGKLKEALMNTDDISITADWKKTADIFKNIISLKKENVADMLFLRSCFDRIVYNVINAKKFNLSGNINSVHARQLMLIEDYIKNNYFENISLQSLADRAILSPIYFHKLFTERYGITPAKYVESVRISNAKHLLLTTNKSVAEIAEKCGFSSQSYFNYKFKEEQGISPLKYRKKMLSRMDP